MTNLNNLLVKPPTLNERRQLVREFKSLLASAPLESNWQRFFEKNPYILADALPVKMNRLYARPQLPVGEPDYVFVNQDRSEIGGDIGSIELKRNTHRIETRYSSRHILPSKHLTIATHQSLRYLESIARGDFSSDGKAFICTRRYAFIIMGRNLELGEILASEVDRLQLMGLIPRGIHLLTFDELYSRYVASIQTMSIIVCSELGENKISQSNDAKRVARIMSTGGLCGANHLNVLFMVDAAQKYASDVTYSCQPSGDSEPVVADGKSIMQMMMLPGTPGAEITLSANGRDAQNAVEELASLIESGCGGNYECLSPNEIDVHRAIFSDPSIQKEYLNANYLNPPTYEQWISRYL